MEEVTGGKVKGIAEKLSLKRSKELSSGGKGPNRESYHLYGEIRSVKLFATSFNLCAKIRSFFRSWFFKCFFFI